MNTALETEIRGFFPFPHRSTAYLATVDSRRGFVPEVRPVTLMEDGWNFYFPTSGGTRKAAELAAHPRAAALVHFRKDAFSGYLRITGRTEPVAAVSEIRKVAATAEYRLEGHWQGADDPTLVFTRLVPERIEYLRPGDEDAKDVTAELRGG